MPRPLDLRRDVDLQPLLTLATPARAGHFLRAQTAGQVAAGARWAAEQGLPLLPLGGGSNLLLCADYPGLVLQPAIQGLEESRAADGSVRLRVGAGQSWQSLVDYSLARGYWGLENLNLIPGTVGAAPIQNIGAYGVELERCFDGLTALNIHSGEQRRFGKADCAFGYRDSCFKRAERGTWVILEVALSLSTHPAPVLDYPALAEQLAVAGPLTPARVGAAVAAIRRAKLPDPAELPNAGSFFHNPVVTAAQYRALQADYPDLVAYAQPDGRFKLAAGWLIERCGLKGTQQAGVAVHERQALVLVNPGRATGQQVLAFARWVAGQVRERFGVELAIEPQIVS